MGISPLIQKVVARFLVRDDNKVGAEISLEGLEVFISTDMKRQQPHTWATFKAERESLKQVTSSLLPLHTHKEQAHAKTMG